MPAPAAAVLAGGASRRMGRAKALLEVDGRRMIDRVVEAIEARLEAIDHRHVVLDPAERTIAFTVPGVRINVGGIAKGWACEQVVGGTPSDLAVGVPVVADRHPGDGPLGGLLTAFAELGEAEAVCMVPCDVPLLSAQALAPLLAAWRDAADTTDVVVAVTDRLEPMCAIWSRVALPRIEAAFDSGERSLRGVLADLQRREVSIDGEALRNVNTPGELDDLRRIGSADVTSGGNIDREASGG